MNMFVRLKHFLGRLVYKSTYIHHQPVNKVSIFILILIDVFVLSNVFFGLASISQLPLTPAEEFPCFSSYEQYQTSQKQGKFKFDTETIETAIEQNKVKFDGYPDLNSTLRLGRVSSACTDHRTLKKAINTPQNLALKTSLDQDRKKIVTLTQENQSLQSRYDSTLLEKIAGQSPQKSINAVSSDEVKAKIDVNKAAIKKLQQQIQEKHVELLNSPTASDYLKLLNNTQAYAQLKKLYKTAEFWHPNLQLLLQTLFLLPLIFIAYFWHVLSSRKNRGLQALLSWHLLLIFCLPLLIKLFEFIQFGNIIQGVLEWIVKVLGGLLFVASYGLILVIPLFGFGLIKFLQSFVFNAKLQAKNRVQKHHCVSCNSKLRLGDDFCPHCGFSQYLDCPSCHAKTYKLVSFCKACGHPFEPM